MLDISTLLTVKGSSSKPHPQRSFSPILTTNTDPNPTSKAPKKKKQQKNSSDSSVMLSSGTVKAPETDSFPVETAPQKENVPNKTRNKPTNSLTATPHSGLANGFPDKSPSTSKKAAVVTTTNNDQPEQEEDFPALMANKPPPGTSTTTSFCCKNRIIPSSQNSCMFFITGFRTSFPIKASNPSPSTTIPPPPPGLGMMPPKPPPGFTGIPLNSNVPEPPSSSVNT